MLRLHRLESREAPSETLHYLFGLSSFGSQGLGSLERDESVRRFLTSDAVEHARLAERQGPDLSHWRAAPAEDTPSRHSVEFRLDSQTARSQPDFVPSVISVPDHRDSDYSLCPLPSNADASSGPQFIGGNTADSAAEPAPFVISAPSVAPPVQQNTSQPGGQPAAAQVNDQPSARSSGSTRGTPTPPRTRAAQITRGDMPGPQMLTNAKGDVIYVVDVNKGAVLLSDPNGDEIVEDDVNHDFSEWSVDLRSQILSDEDDITYDWDFKDADDAINISAFDEYDVQFEWDSFNVGPNSVSNNNKISLTITFGTGGGAYSETLDFNFVVMAVDSNAWLPAPTNEESWPLVMTPDMLQSSSAMHMGHNYSIDLVDGSISTSFEMPSYNPGVAPVRFVYNSATAQPVQTFVVRHELDPDYAAPSSFVAELIIDSVGQGTITFDTERTIPGDFLHMPLTFDASSLSSGRHDWKIEVFDGSDTVTYDGSFNLINDSDSPFGAGWWIDFSFRVMILSWHRPAIVPCSLMRTAETSSALPAIFPRSPMRRTSGRALCRMASYTDLIRMAF